MHKMNRVIVVYYSLNGNSAYVAEKIAGETGCDVLAVEPEKDYPKSGFMKFFRGGKSAVMKEMPALKPYQFRAENYDHVILGLPVWASNVTPPIRTFIHENMEVLKDKKISAYVCESGAGGEKVLDRLQQELQNHPFEATMILIDPKEKQLKENDERISEFCRKLGM